MRPHNQYRCDIPKMKPIKERDPEELAEMLSDQLMLWSGDFIEHNALTKEQKEELAAEKRRRQSMPESYRTQPAEA